MHDYDNKNKLNEADNSNLSNRPTRKLNKKILLWWIIILFLFALILLYHNFTESRLFDWQEILPTSGDDRTIDIVTYL